MRATAGLFIPILMALTSSACTRLACGRDIVKSEEVSPDGRFVAGVLERNCGATTPYGDYAAIRARGDSWTSDAMDDAVLVVSEQTPIAAFWKPDGSLVVRIKKAALPRVVHKSERHQGITIKHVVEADSDPDQPGAPDRR
jgi:hypothetical protein